jgi:AP-3 complex subunit beta
MILIRNQAPAVKLQSVVLASKLLVLLPENRTLQLLTRYILNLARYDQNYDVRDRGRMMASLLSGINYDLGVPEERVGVVFRKEQVRLILFEGKSSAGGNKSQREGRL